jgi:sphingolipid delta-4 desaturase
MVGEWKTFPAVLFLVTLQFSVAYICQQYTLPWYVVVLLSYVIGGTVNHSLQLLVHELSHNLCFSSVIGNRLLAICANFPTTMPSAVLFQKYHMEHHQNQGVDGLDTDIPSRVEVFLFRSIFGKLLWVILQPLFYSFRPLLVHPRPVGFWEVFNFVAVALSDVAVLTFIGPRGFAYLISGTFLGLGLHPTAGHFIAEHYVFYPGQETYSYYGICNFFNFNVGYHNEHHDFPRIPWTNLPKLREIAPEFYDLPCHRSYLSVFYHYLTDPRIGPHSRIKRLT